MYTIKYWDPVTARWLFVINTDPLAFSSEARLADIYYYWFDAALQKDKLLKAHPEKNFKVDENIITNVI